MSDIPESPQPTPPPYAEPVHAHGTVSAEERQWGMFAHLAALLGLVIPFGNIIGPLIVWLVKKDTMPFVDDQGKESLNFQITATIALLLSMALMIVLIGFLLMPIIALAVLIMTIIGAVKANEGRYYRYPFALRLIK